MIVMLYFALSFQNIIYFQDKKYWGNEWIPKSNCFDFNLVLLQTEQGDWLFSCELELCRDKFAGRESRWPYNLIQTWMLGIPILCCVVINTHDTVIISPIEIHCDATITLSHIT